MVAVAQSGMQRPKSGVSGQGRARPNVVPLPSMSPARCIQDAIISDDDEINPV